MRAVDEYAHFDRDLGLVYEQRVGGVEVSLHAYTGTHAEGPYIAFFCERQGMLRRYRQQILWQAAASDNARQTWAELSETLSWETRRAELCQAWPEGGLWALQRFLWRSTGFHFLAPMKAEAFFGRFELRQQFGMRLMGSVESGMRSSAAIEPYLIERAKVLFVGALIGRYSQGVGSMEGSRRQFFALPLEGLSKALAAAAKSTHSIS